MRTPLLSVVLVVALSGCGDDTGSGAPAAASTPSAAVESAAPPTPVAASSPTGQREGIVVDDTSVAGVRLGTPAAEAERRLVARLGPARKIALPGCNGESGFWLSWEALTVVLSDDQSDDVVLQGWTVVGGGTQAFALPHDVQPGTPVREVLSRVPEAKGVPGEGATDGQYLVHTARTPDLLWLSGTFDDSGVVDEVSFRDATCD